MTEPLETNTITKAVDYGDYIELTVIFKGEDWESLFILTPDDHFGASDALREQLDAMVAAGEITIEPPPPEPKPLPV
ncbi:hypothetical protein I6F26_10105 [Ensifer sp. IC3342]|nr:hypothetical protein [Ensifer sp. BRP08]MCA1446931.1 hypothetical protein [Ensifer sp. IC3342]